jgi:hypothetical protein
MDSKAAIPRSMVRDIYMPRKTKAALVQGICPDCGRTLEVVDTWEGACPDPDCGFTINYYHWPWVTADLPPEGES